MHDIRYDAVHDEIFIPSPFGRAILVFRGGAHGEEAPIRIIQGPNTRVTDRLDVDPVHNEIFVPGRDAILVYPRNGNGDVAPLRVIRGPDTEIRSARAIAVDPIHNLIIVGDDGGRKGPDKHGRDGALLIFNRTDNGNAKPRAVIAGSKTNLAASGQIQVYGPKGWIIVTRSGDDQRLVEPEGVFIGIWSIHDNGNVPPHWKIEGPKSMLKRPRGVVLNPKNKEIIVADMRLNGVLTYYFPEIF